MECITVRQRTYAPVFLMIFTILTVFFPFAVTSSCYTTRRCVIMPCDIRPHFDVSIRNGGRLVFNQPATGTSLSFRNLDAPLQSRAPAKLVCKHRKIPQGSYVPPKVCWFSWYFLRARLNSLYLYYIGIFTASSARCHSKWCWATLTWTCMQYYAKTIEQLTNPLSSVMTWSCTTALKRATVWTDSRKWFNEIFAMYLSYSTVIKYAIVWKGYRALPIWANFKDSAWS